jgi:hypothetical protein
MTHAVAWTLANLGALGEVEFSARLGVAYLMAPTRLARIWHEPKPSGQKYILNCINSGARFWD